MLSVTALVFCYAGHGTADTDLAAAVDSGLPEGFRDPGRRPRRGWSPLDAWRYCGPDRSVSAVEGIDAGGRCRVMVTTEFHNRKFTWRQYWQMYV
jgi:hypothetical protein